MIFSKTQRGKPALHTEGRIYVFDKLIGENDRWRCSKRSCKGSITLNPNKEIFTKIEHSCLIQEFKSDKIIALNAIKNKIILTRTPIIEVITDVTKELTPNVLSILPKIETIRDDGTRKRNKIDNFVVKVEDIPEALRVTLTKQKFLQYDSGQNDDSRIIIFFSNENLKLIQETEIWVVDGTFKSVPGDFYQMITLQGKVFGKFFSLVYILMKKKDEVNYTKVFNYLKENFKIELKNVIIDFEVALKNSLEKTFNSVKIYGCNFHFTQNVLRKIQSLGLSQLYKDDEQVNSIFRMFLNLSFIKEERKQEGFNFIIEKIKKLKLENIFKEFISYFERMYFGTSTKLPVFQFQFWSVEERIKLEIPRTTNNIEAWHRGFNSLVGVRHSNIGRFIHALQLDTEKNRLKLARLSVGEWDSTRIDLNREFTLKTIVNNEKRLSVEILFKILGKINNWKFE